jgi:hypothetical protein
MWKDSSGSKANPDFKRKLVVNLLKPVEFVYLAFFRLAVIAMGYKRIKIGRCSFWGPSFFTGLANDAFVFLNEKDPALCEELKENGVFFWYSPSTLVESAYSGTFSITNQLLQREEFGIVGRLVWAHYKTKAFRRRFFFPRERSLAQSEKADVTAKTEFWLRHHGFDLDLMSLLTSRAPAASSDVPPKSEK